MVQAPANAALARVFFRMKGTVAGQNDSYLWLYQVYFGEGVAGQSAPSKWSDGFSTLISGGNIVTGSVTADKIATNAVTAGKIAAGAVTAGTIAAGAVTAATIAAESITGDKIAANTIGANQIAAGAITAKSLILTDFSNMADNGWQGGNMDGWEYYALYAYAYSSGEGDASGYYARSTSGYGQFYSRPISVSPGEKYAFDVWVQNNTAPAAQVWMFCYDANGNNFRNEYVAGTTVQNAWFRLQGQATVPAGAVRVRMCLYTNATAALTAPGIAWSKPVMRRATSAELIVDGAITANKIAANAITADKLAAGAITADKIATGSISTDKLIIGGVDATRIAKGSVTRSAAVSFSSGSIGPWTTIKDWGMDNGNPSAVVNNFSVTLTTSGGAGGNTGYVRVYNVTDNYVVWQVGVYAPPQQNSTASHSYLVQLELPPAAPGARYYVVQAYSVLSCSGFNYQTWNYR